MAHRDAAAIRREQHLFDQRIELRLVAPKLAPGLSVQRGHPISGRD
jgi:hypothetical protein